MYFWIQFMYDVIDVINNEKRYMIIIEYPIILIIWYTIENYFNTNEIYSTYLRQYINGSRFLT